MSDLLGRRVRWPVEPIYDQSLIGLVVSTAKHNLHDNIGTILGMAGIPHARGLGHAMLDHHRQTALAHALNQPLHEVQRRAHLPVSDGSIPNAVDFFGACVPGHDVHHGVRRVGATNDPGMFYHRALWQLVRVPIDLSSGFRVTGACMSCGASLGWRNTVAAQRCDDCGRTVNDKAPDAEAGAVRNAGALAALIDPRPSVHVPAYDNLHATLREENRGVVFYLGYRLGLALTETQTVGRIGAGQSLGFEDGLAVLDLGGRMIAQWPDGIADLLRQRASKCPDAGVASARAVQRLASSTNGWPQHGAMMAAALPTMQRSARTFLGSLMADALDAAASASFLGIDSRQVSQLHHAKALPALMESRGTRALAVFSQQTLVEVRDALNDQMSLASVANALGICRHGVEQLVCENLLVQNAHSAVVVLYGGVRVSRRSLATLAEKLDEKKKPAVRSFIPAYSLRLAAYVIGGREKSWGQVFARLLAGEVKYTMSNSNNARMVDRIMIDPADAAVLFDGRFERSGYPDFPFVADMARREASELLNLSRKSAICFEALPAECRLRGKRLAIAPMLQIASRYISPQEIKARWGVEAPLGLGEKAELGWPRLNAEGSYGVSRPRTVQGAFDFSPGHIEHVTARPAPLPELSEFLISSRM